MRARRLTLLLVALTTAALTVTVGLGASAPARAAGAGDVTGLVNGARSAAGLGPLTPDSRLAGVAQAWAEQMAADGSLSHNPSTGARIPGGWSAWAENVAWSTDPSPAGLHANLMGSAGHRANILSPTFTSVGVGYATDGAGGAYVAEVFAAYPGAAAPAPQPPPAQAAPDTSSAGAGGQGGADGTGSTGRASERDITDSGAAVAPRAPTGLVLGASGADVRTLQERLQVHGQVLEADGAYGPATAAAVIAFQRTRGLDPDGIVGPATLAALALDPAPPVTPAPASPEAQAPPAGPTDADRAAAAREVSAADRAQDARGAAPSGSASGPTPSPGPSSPADEALPAVPAYGWVIAALAVLAAMSLSVVGARRRSAQVRRARPPQD
ncbi:peptidoglycan-binding protein [Oerskovia sp. Sa1BUA8]|uniref:Peptidoglycan-binding protein n=1 Tax=Oerskovia douganii TaxID=2762210 RepID=A0A9D5U8U8_9CELL|nr:CAP domain-containing protein [Oerskovia douganii]MBE7700395.1 peptidoglycan-binding protein [Oerskovia douganii]